MTLHFADEKTESRKIKCLPQGHTAGAWWRLLFKLSLVLGPACSTNRLFTLSYNLLFSLNLSYLYFYVNKHKILKDALHFTVIGAP